MPTIKNMTEAERADLISRVLSSVLAKKNEPDIFSSHGVAAEARAQKGGEKVAGRAVPLLAQHVRAFVEAHPSDPAVKALAKIPAFNDFIEAIRPLLAPEEDDEDEAEDAASASAPMTATKAPKPESSSSPAAPTTAPKPKPSASAAPEPPQAPNPEPTAKPQAKGKPKAKPQAKGKGKAAAADDDDEEASAANVEEDEDAVMSAFMALPEDEQLKAIGDARAEEKRENQMLKDTEKELKELTEMAAKKRDEIEEHKAKAARATTTKEALETGFEESAIKRAGEKARSLLSSAGKRAGPDESIDEEEGGASSSSASSSSSSSSAKKKHKTETVEDYAAATLTKKQREFLKAQMAIKTPAPVTTEVEEYFYDTQIKDLVRLGALVEK